MVPTEGNSVLKDKFSHYLLTLNQMESQLRSQETFLELKRKIELQHSPKQLSRWGLIY